MTNQQAPEALRLRNYVERRKRAKQLDVNKVHAFDTGCDTEAELLLSDVETLLSLVDAQQPTTHVQNPAEIEHVAGGVSKNGAESNMAQHPPHRLRQPAAEPVTSGVADGAVWVRYDLTDGLKEQAIKDQLIALGWTPPPAGAKPSPTPQADSAPASVAGPMQFGGCPECGSRTCVARQCSRTMSHTAQALPGVQWQCGPQANGFTAPQANSQPAPSEEAILSAARNWGEVQQYNRTDGKGTEHRIVFSIPRRAANFARELFAASAQADSVTAPAYSIDADPQGIRARVAEAITGALAFGAQGANPPPTGHWLVPFWETAREEASRNRPVSSDTLYLLRRLLSNQHTLTGSEFREELTKIVGEATQAADSVLEDAERWRMLPAFFEEYQIDAMKLYRDIDAAIAARKQGANHD